MALERTLSIVKPDGVRANHIGEVCRRFEKAFRDSLCKTIDDARRLGAVHGNFLDRPMLVNCHPGRFGGNAQRLHELAVIDLMIFRREQRPGDLSRQMRLPLPRVGGRQPFERQAETFLELQAVADLGLIDQLLAWRDRLGKLVFGRRPTLEQSPRAVIAFGGLQDCCLQFPDTPYEKFRRATVDGALAALGIDQSSSG